jgi:pimeloyl-ACP methyl ester carboxylesterase
MAKTFDEKIPFSGGDFEFYGLFKRGQNPARARNPLIVLLHGGGATAAYFDNPCHSYDDRFLVRSRTLQLISVGPGW